MAENGENIKKSIILRMNLVLLTIGLLGFVIVGKVLYLQYGNSGYWKKQGLQNHVFMDTIRPMRGNILSADGMLLATSITIYDLYMDCQPGGSTDGIFNEYMATF